VQALGVAVLLRVQVREEQGTVLDQGLRERKGGREGGKESEVAAEEEVMLKRKRGREHFPITCATTISSSFCSSLASSTRAERAWGR
jgi:hypothetical protein